MSVHLRTSVEEFLQRTRCPFSVKKSVHIWMLRHPTGWKRIVRPPGGRMGASFDANVWEEVEAEAQRLGWTFSKIMQLAWKLARKQMRTMQGPVIGDGP